MEFTQLQLNKILRKHKKWLHGEYVDGERADLSWADLSYAQLRCTDLSGADLQGANLSHADLRGADLSRARLIDANLSSAYLGGVKLRNADLRYADLRYADLRGADLTGVNLGETALSYARLDKTYYQVVHLGSKNATTTYCVEDNKVICECSVSGINETINETLEDFERRVKKEYGVEGRDYNNKYYTQYTEAIKFFKAMKELGTVKGEEM